jgi:hypothetical protein
LSLPLNPLLAPLKAMIRGFLVLSYRYMKSINLIPSPSFPPCHLNLTDLKLARHQWLTPVILATQQVEIRRI